jgi:hypothetical protein
MRRALLLALAAALLSCAPAQAAFTPFALASASPAQGIQADYAYDPAISGNGRYVVFVGSVKSVPGIYRGELVPGEPGQPPKLVALQAVAYGNHAGAPSISASGQYVSFTSDQNPATGSPGGDAACSSVYVRNMQQAPESEPAHPISKTPDPWQPEKQPAGTSEPPAFTLASAPDGSSESLTYVLSVLTPNRYGACGAATAARVALSANGQEVAFTVLSSSNLTGACSEEEETLTCPTPPNQVAVRDLETKTTTLVSSTLASQGATPQPVPVGAALSGPTVTPVTDLPRGGAVELPLGASTAAISADGSTVSWMGIEVAAQAPVAQPLPGVPDDPDSYAEPLWRRISEGPGAPTRRVLAGDDPSAPECPPACPGGLDLAWDTQGITDEEYPGAAPEFGSYTSQAGTSFIAGAGLGGPLAALTPQLSADGGEVALLSTQPTYGEDPSFGLFNASKPPPANAFVVNMAPGLTRAQSIQRLTDWASLNFEDTELDSPIASVALSPDGTRVAFTTARVAFPLAPPALITPTLSQAAVSQLYEVNLAGGTLAMVSFGYNGQPANGGVIAAAFSEDGKTLALASGATNLVYGVVNEGADVFVTEEIHSPAVAGQQSIAPTPPWPAAAIPWNLSATATPSPDGTLDLYVSVPGAGRLSASAVSAVSAQGSASAAKRTRKAARGAHKTAAPSDARRAVAARRKQGSGKKGSTHIRKTSRAPKPLDAQIAHAAANTTGPETIELHLIPAARFDALLRASKYGLYTTITLTFTAPGHRTMHETLRVSFPHRPAIYPIPTAKHRSKRK